MEMIHTIKKLLAKRSKKGNGGGNHHGFCFTNRIGFGMME